MTLLLSIRDLTVLLHSRQGTPTQIGPIDLPVKSKGITALIGESGCGKTVVSLAVLRLLPPDALVQGEIWFREREILSLPESELINIRGGGIAYIPQNPASSLNPVLKAGDQIAEVIQHHRGLSGPAVMEEVYETLSRLGVRETERVAGSCPYALSGGLRRRVAIAAALAGDPQLVIADEPTAGLDYHARGIVLDLLARVAGGRAMLLITHDLDAAAAIGDEIAVMYAGDILEQGPASTVLSSPAHPYTRGLIAALPSRELQPIPGESPLLTSLPPGCRFAPRCERATRGCYLKRPRLRAPCHGRAVRCDAPC